MAQKQHKKNKELWIYGVHPVEMALQNRRRVVREIWIAKELPESVQVPKSVPVKSVTRDQLDSVLGAGALHQGIAARCDPLPPVALEDVVDQSKHQDATLIVFLDQVTDPHNIGAILRSAAAFNAAAVVVPDAGAPDETGVLAKSASGALELIPLIRVPNLVRAMEYLKKEHFWCVGMDGYAKKTIAEDKLPSRCALIMGSEGDGMRRLTSEKCDYTVKLPMNKAVESLNVSNACAIALYEWHRLHH